MDKYAYRKDYPKFFTNDVLEDKQYYKRNA